MELLPHLVLLLLLPLLLHLLLLPLLLHWILLILLVLDLLHSLFLMLPCLCHFSAIIIALCLASWGVAIEPYCLANANTLCSCPMHCIAILFHCLCIVRARKLTTRLLRRNKELIMHFKAETMMTLHYASPTQLHRARNLILL